MTRVLRAGRVTFAALSVPNYRRYYAGQSVSLIGTWMQMTAQSWLVLSITHSSTALGVIVALQTLPVLLLGPYGGVIADRVDKRKLMIALQSVMGLQALALGVLTATGTVRVWQIGLLAAMLGLNNAFENPARQSFMMELVGPEHLRNAVSLNSVLVNVARSIGPAVAGILIATVGDDVCFLANAASFAAVVFSLTTMDATALSPSKLAPRARGQLREGLRYIRSMPELAVPLVMMGVAGCLDVRVPGVAPGDGRPGVERGRRRVRLHDRGDRGRRGGRRAVRGRPGQDRGAAADRCRVRARGRARGRGAGPQPRHRADRTRPGWIGQHRVHVDGQLDAPAQRRAQHARAGHVAVVRRLPGLDADRRSADRSDDGRDRAAGRAGHWSAGRRAGRLRRFARPAPPADLAGDHGRSRGRRLESTV